MKNFVGQKISPGWNGLLDMVFPPRCLLSHEPVERQGMIAPKIWSKLNFISAPHCVSCGVPFEYEVAHGTRCASCLEQPPDYDMARAALVYDDISRDLILGFKHADQTHAVTAFVPWLKQAGAEMLARADMIVPVPLHRWRLLKRRYNQSAILAQYLGRAVEREVCVDALIRTRATPPQGHLKPDQRERNVRKAFIKNPRYHDDFKDKNIVLIDDVYTSGATANECAKVLRERAKAARVDVLAIARVVKN